MQVWNDPMMDDDLLIDGVRGFIQRRYEDFQLDFSQYITLIEESYTAQIAKDQRLGKFIPASAYTYYMIILLWRRILQVTPYRGNSHFENLSKALPQKLPVPKEIKLYLDSIGSVVDSEGLKWRFNFTPELTSDEFYDACGSYGRISDITHLWYETLPAPIIPLLAMRADILRTNHKGDYHWALPAELTPKPVGSHLPANPTLNLLGYSYARRLTSDQVDVLLCNGISVTGAATEETCLTVRHIANIPVVQSLMSYLAGQFLHSKCAMLEYDTLSLNGSLAQIPFTVRVGSCDFIHCVSDQAASHKGVTKSYRQFTPHIASAPMFRFRFQRWLDDSQCESFCYTWVTNGLHAPQAWKDNANNLYSKPAKWNIDDFTLEEVYGRGVLKHLAQRTKTAEVHTHQCHPDDTKQYKFTH